MRIRIRLLFLLLTSILVASSVYAERVCVVPPDNSPQSAYATRRLGSALVARGHQVVAELGAADWSIVLNVENARLAPEAFSIRSGRCEIDISGGDKRGLIYGSLALVELLGNGVTLERVPMMEEKPKLPFRGLKFNLPWETYRASSALDQHYETARDLKFWEAFLDMMVEDRFNVISLWNLNPFTYMIRSRNFPEASPWTEAQQAEWQHFYREIFRMAKERGLDTYVVHWNIFVSRSFAEATASREKTCIQITTSTATRPTSCAVMCGKA
jgi:hypothetical protein